MDITFSIPNLGEAGLVASDANFRYEVARLRLHISLSGSPAGATLTYNGVVVALGGAQLIGNDLLEFSQIAGTNNNVQIDLLLMSHFLGNDFRNYNYSANPNPRIVALTLTSDSTPTELRWAAYSTATEETGTSAYRRATGRTEDTEDTEDTEQEILVTVTTMNPALPTTNNRLPLDVIFVMDRSGSMNNNVPSTTTTKFSLLQTSIDQFIDTFSQESTSQPDDRIALIWFSSGTEVVLVNGTTWTPRSGWASVQQAVNNATAGGNTAMGDGVSQGVAAWTNDDRHDPMLVLFTDGMQNTGNEIEDRPPAGDLDYYDLDDGAYRPLRHRAIPMGVIGIGVQAAYSGILQQISSETGGDTYFDAEQGAGIGYAYHDQLIAALKGNPLSLLERAQSTLLAGQQTYGPITMSVGRDTPQLICCLYWLGLENRASLDIVFVAPDGSRTNPDQRADGLYYITQTLNNPEPGQWQVFVSRSREQGGQSQSAIPFYLSAMVSEGPFRMNLRHAASAYRAGEEIYLVLEFEEGGQPLSLAQAHGRVTCEILGPSIDVGTYLHELSMLNFDQLTSVLGEEFVDIDDPVTLKLAYYNRAGRLDALLLPDRGFRFTFEFGQNISLPEDVQQGNSGLSIRYAQTPHPGTYRCRVLVELETEVSGRVVRRAETTLHLGLATIDPERSIVRAREYKTRLSRYAYLNIQVYDRLGNMLGPGYDDRIDVQAKLRRGRVSYMTNLNATSEYTFRITGLMQDEDPLIVIRVFDQVLRKALLSELVWTPPRTPPWWRKKLTQYKRRITQRRKRRLIN